MRYQAGGVKRCLLDSTPWAFVETRLDEIFAQTDGTGALKCPEIGRSPPPKSYSESLSLSPQVAVAVATGGGWSVAFSFSRTVACYGLRAEMCLGKPAVKSWGCTRHCGKMANQLESDGTRWNQMVTARTRWKLMTVGSHWNLAEAPEST